MSRFAALVLVLALATTCTAQSSLADSLRGWIDAAAAQIGFGAGGPHFCLGANLARREIAVMFDEIRRRLPNLEITGEPAYLQSNFINGIKRLPARF